MNEENLLKRIQLLEYHQNLLFNMLAYSDQEFYKLVISKKVSEQETQLFLKTCEKMSKNLEEQKAEGFVYFHPLFNEFQSCLPKEIKPSEMIKACLKQKLFVPLMSEFKKYL